MMLAAAKTLWVLYIFSANAGWVPMGQRTFSDEAACGAHMASINTTLSAMLGHTRPKMRCRPAGWDGKDADMVPI